MSKLLPVSINKMQSQDELPGTNTISPVDKAKPYSFGIGFPYNSFSITNKPLPHIEYSHRSCQTERPRQHDMAMGIA